MLIIPGSEPNDRDGNQASLPSDCIKILGNKLAGHGIAVLRFDKRGSGRSRFLPDKESDFRFNSMITDAEQLPSYPNPELPLAPELVPTLLGFLGKELAVRPLRAYRAPVARQSP